MKRGRLFVSAALLGPVLVGSIAGAADWPNWRGPNRDGISDEAGWDPTAMGGKPSPAWRHNTGFGGLIAADNKLIVLNEKGRLFVAEAKPTEYRELAAGDTGLGKTCWTAPVLSNGRLYCRNDKGDLVCIAVAQP